MLPSPPPESKGKTRTLDKQLEHPAPVKDNEPPAPVKDPESPQTQQLLPLTGKQSPKLECKVKDEKNIQNTSQDKTSEKEIGDKAKAETEKHEEEVNQSKKDETQASNKNENQSNIKTVVGKDRKNKDIQKNVKRLDSKLFAAPLEMPEQEKKEENELSANSSVKTYKTSDTSDKKSTDAIKRSVIDELRKSGKGKPVAPRIRKQLSNSVTTTDDRRSTFEHKTSRGTLLKGSNVTRANLSRQSSGSSNSSNKSQPKARSTTNSRWTWDDPDLAKHLTIQKVKSDELTPEPIKAPPNSSMSNYPSKAKPDGMKATSVQTEKVKPKKISVKPKDATEEKVGGRQSIQRRASVTVTGKALGPESPDRPLPERTPSKVCNIQ